MDFPTLLGRVRYQFNVSWVVFYLFLFKFELIGFFFKENNSEPDLSPRAVVTDLGLYYLLMPYLADARFMYIENNILDNIMFFFIFIVCI